MHPAKSLTRYHDKLVYKHVLRVHRVVNVTRVQPIIHIHDITRVHHRTIVRINDVYSRVTQQLMPIRTIEYSTQNYYDCNCGR